MIVVTLVAAVVLLVLANVEVYRKSSSSSPTIWIFAGVGLFGLLSCFSLVVVAQAIILAGLFTFWRWRRWSPLAFLPASVVGVLLTYLMPYGMYLREKPKFDAMREEFRFESMADRLPTDTSNTASQFDAMMLGVLDEYFAEEVRTGERRSKMLQQLHEEQVREFIHQPGFGQIRMLDMRPRREYIIGYDPSKLLRQPNPFPTTAPATEPVSPVTLRMTLNEHAHMDNIVDFINARGFGYFKDRDHVAGFQPHQFRTVPKFGDRWELERVDLVGLLLHKQPVVYVSDNLPRMDKLRQAPTRPLDEFETAALADIRKGNELHLAETPTGARMVGAIRSVSQCNNCHATERGTLLGAFSYTLKKGK